MLNKYIALDVETTGLNPKVDELIEIAAIKFEDGQVVDEFVTLLRPSFKIPAKITQITGITGSMVMSSPSFSEVASSFIEFCAGSLIVCHNAQFDMGFIYEQLGRLGFDFPNKIACTLEMARAKLNLDSNKLESVSRHLGLEGCDFHRAKADAICCGEIFWYLSQESGARIQDSGESDSSKSINEQVWTVSELNTYIKNSFDSNPNLMNVTIVGEISNFKKNFSGHLYLSLKDEKCTVNAVMFKGVSSRLKFAPENGMKVIATGRVSVYEASGQYQLYIENMQVSGVGDLHVAYEQLKNKLEAMGYFSAERKKPIPKFPRKFGIVTSATGSVIQDIINVATRRFPACELILYPAKVQGEGAAAEIVAGIEYFGTRDDISTLIIGRGGGSLEDLWCFNEEAVATAIFNSPMPIISAVGHETDFTIADFVADLRAPTPSAAAEIAVPNSDDIKENLAGLYKRSLFALRADIERKRELIKRFSVKSPIDVINIYRLRLDNLIEKKVNLTSNLLAKHKADLANHMAKLDALSPLKVMSRGYNFAVDSSGNVIKRALDMKADDKIILTFADGRASATVEEARRTQCAPTT